jgi:hypothetical protein
MEERAEGVDLKIDETLEGGVVVEGSGTKQPRAENVVVQVGLERLQLLNELESILDDLGVDDLNTSDLGGRISRAVMVRSATFLVRDNLVRSGACLARSCNGGAGYSQGRGEDGGELHVEDLKL